MPPDYPQYELWAIHKNRNMPNWRQVPFKHQYETIFKELHSKFHEGRETCHKNFQKRYWFPFHKVYFEDFMIYCEVCELKRLKIKRYNRVPPSVVLFEENPLDRIQVDIVTLNSTIKEIDSKFHYVLSIVDHHSKKAWAKALKNKKPWFLTNSSVRCSRRSRSTR